ncbi:3-mercaptopyruvate sulfurtransferase-like isoform X2 [Oscarella lobularis]|uniref:3-mercaptopyruvate sulfurtransferase-like isoform X2 n=1 Tax=Oscarella lobularis TaxID=121494 RepID=UPI0033139AEF
MARVQPLVGALWLSNRLREGLGRIRILDASWHMPATGRNASEEFAQRRIPTAQFFDVDRIADQKSDLPHMLPSPSEFEEHVAKLGIGNDSHVVVYDNNASGLFSAARVWWTFRVFGHDDVSVLDGGLPKWIENGCSVEDGQAKAPIASATFRVHEFRSGLVRTFQDIKENVQSNVEQVADARSEGRFDGTAPEPRPGLPSGHISHSRNVHYQSLLDPQTRTLKSSKELLKVFDSAGISLSKPMIATCGSGITACLIAFAAFVCNQENVAVYDGAWTEWALKAGPQQIVTKNEEGTIA